MSPGRSKSRLWCAAGLLASACAAAGAAERGSDIVSAAARAHGAESYRPVLSWHRQRPGAPEPAVTPVPRSVHLYRGPLPAVLSRRPFHQEIVNAARKAGIDPALVHAVIRVESAYNAQAVSSKGAVGLMQVIPGTGRRYGVEDLLNPRANLSAGTQYLSHLMRIFEGDVRLVLAAYNAGENAVLRHGRSIPPYRETRGYVPRVMGIYEALAEQGRQEATSASTVRPE